jgi:hypothetical protein
MEQKGRDLCSEGVKGYEPEDGINRVDADLQIGEEGGKCDLI